MRDIYIWLDLDHRTITRRQPTPHQRHVLGMIWNDGGAYLRSWRSVFKKKAPHFIDRIEELPGIRVGRANTTPNISEELLGTLTEAYEHAAN